MLTHDLISHVSKAHINGTPVVLIEDRNISPEQMLVRQYNEIAKCVDELDQYTFKLARIILKDIAVDAPDNLAVQALNIFANAALEELTPEQCDFLENNAAQLNAYGIDPYLFTAGEWSEQGNYTREVEALKRSALGQDQINVGYLNRLLEAFTKAGEPVVKLVDFANFCEANGIAIEPHDVVCEERTQHGPAFCISRAQQLYVPGGSIR